MRKVFDVVKKIMLVVLVIVLLCGCSWYESHYTKDCAVVSIADDVVTVRDAQGHLWEFISDEYKVADVVRITFYTNHTDTELFDDEIVDVR